MAAILALETNLQHCSCAIETGDNAIYSLRSSEPMQHSKLLLGFVHELLEQANTTLSDVQAIAFTQGPGSFTGVRMGVSVAQGLGIARNIAMIPVSSLQLMALSGVQQYENVSYKSDSAHKLNSGDILVACIDARLAEMYTGFFKLSEISEQNGAQVGVEASRQEALYGESELIEILAQLDSKHGSVTVFGFGLENFPQLSAFLCANKIAFIDGVRLDAIDLLGIARQKWSLGEYCHAHQAHANYVRQKIADVPKRMHG